MKKHKYNIFPEMKQENYQMLLTDLKANGYDKKQPIYLYDGGILDGWNRFKACSELGINPTYIEFVGTSVEAIEFVMRTNKRRNLSSQQWAVIAIEADEIVEAIKETVEAERRRKQAETLKETHKNGEFGKEEESCLVQLIEPNNNKKDNSALATTKLAEAFNTNRTYISQAQKLKATDPEKLEQVKTGEITFADIKKAHVSNNSGENEWYTPVCYIESAVKVMGSIDLDPASSQIANKTVKAKKYYNEEENGLFKKWIGNIWMNPPYSQPLINDFISKLETEKYTQAIVLVNNATETKWGQKLLQLSSAVCFHTGRIRFISPNGVQGAAPLQGQIIAYIGPNFSDFIEEFKKYGICLMKGV